MIGRVVFEFNNPKRLSLRQRWPAWVYTDSQSLDTTIHFRLSQDFINTLAIMLGTRTKQVYSYGRRNQRIVNVSEEPDRLKKDVTSIFDDPPAPRLGPVASRMKKRENTVPAKVKSPSPKISRMQKKKRLSPVLSPLKKKRTRVAQIINAEIHKPELPVAKPKPKPKPKLTNSETNDPEISTAPRAPLTPFPLNVPGSPAFLERPRDKVKVTSKGTPMKLNRPFSPFIDMDNIVLDDEGRTVNQERRVSRMDVENNPINHRKSKSIVIDSESDTEISELPKRSKRVVKRALTLIIQSDESDSDIGLELTPPPPKRTSRAGPSRLKSGVAISPAPIRSAPSRPISQLVPSLPPSPVHAVPARYAHFPSPTIKPRQLTPIRGGRGNRLFDPPSPPSPSTPTDLDFSLDFSELNLGSPSNTYSYHTKPEIPEYLRPLLEECHQETCGPYVFSAFIESFPYDPVLHSCERTAESSVDLQFRKIGEASYSEVFGIGDVVLKVIPLRNETLGDAPTNNSKPRTNEKYGDDQEDQDDREEPAPSDAKDVRKEIIVTRAMGEVCDGFVKLLKTYIVRGKYPEVLLRLWDEYYERKGSESVRPGKPFNARCHHTLIQ